jgi:hypothetical protein
VKNPDHCALLYIASAKNDPDNRAAPCTHTVNGYELKRPTGSSFKRGPGKTKLNCCNNVSKLFRDFDNQAFEGEGDAFATAIQRMPDLRKPQAPNKSEGPISY